MDYEALAHAAAVVGALGAAVVVLGRRRAVFLAALAALVAAESGLAYALVPDAPGLLTESPARIAALFAGGLIAIAAGVLFVRFPGAAPIALLVAAPFRLSVGLGNQEAFLLVPFYVVLIAATGALAFRLARRGPLPVVPLLLAVPAAALAALAGISLLWTRDLRAGTIELVFFYFPFVILLTVVARTRLIAWSFRALVAALVAVTSLFAAIGLYQAWTHTDILAKQDVQLANAYESFFRVTSLFQDPSVYGRHLVLGIVTVVVVLWLGFLRPAAALPVLALLAAGLYFSYSQTSFLALFGAVLIVMFAAGDGLVRRIVGGFSVAIVAAAAVLVLVFGGGDSAREVTSDRLPLAQVTWPVYAAHPVVGVGIGSQPLMSRRQEDASRQKKKNVSHTTPLTVAAELGTLGVLVYLGFLAAIARSIVLVRRRHRGLALVLTGCSTALVLQSIFYGGFFEDPFVWGIVGLAAAALAYLPAHAPPAPVAVREGALGGVDVDGSRPRAVAGPVDEDEREPAR